MQFYASQPPRRQRFISIRRAVSRILRSRISPRMNPDTKPDTSVTWQCTSFKDLTPADLYAAMQLRQMVFVVEQRCAYLDADGVDRVAEHLLGWQTLEGRRILVAYARLLPPRVKYAEPSIGRVVSHPDARGKRVGRELMLEALKRVEQAGWGRGVRIAAQMYLERFYEGFGFKRVTEPYTEDDIWHVDMLRG